MVENREQVAPPSESIEAVNHDTSEKDMPILKEGFAPLLPLPLVVGTAPKGTPALDFVETSALARFDAPKSSGRFVQVVGVALLCTLLAAAALLLLKEFGSFSGGVSASPAVEMVAAPAPAFVITATTAVAPGVALEQLPVATSVADGAAVEPAKQVVTTGPAKPSLAFENHVAGLRVSGVSLGASPRALINNRRVNVGDLIDATMGIRLVAVDGEARQLIFEDRSNARIHARY